MTGNTVILIVLVGLAAVNAAVSVAVARSGYYERGQVIAQTAVIWLIPVLGAALVGVFLRSQRKISTFNALSFQERRESAMADDLYGASHSSHHSHSGGHGSGGHF